MPQPKNSKTSKTKKLKHGRWLSCPLVAKLSFEGTFKRVTLLTGLEEKKKQVSMSRLHQLLVSALPSLAKSKYTLSYQDEDNDIIVISNNLELREAIESAPLRNDRKLLRLNVVRVSRPVADASELTSVDKKDEVVLQQLDSPTSNPQTEQLRVRKSDFVEPPSPISVIQAQSPVVTPVASPAVSPESRPSVGGLYQMFGGAFGGLGSVGSAALGDSVKPQNSWVNPLNPILTGNHSNKESSKELQDDATSRACVDCRALNHEQKTKSNFSKDKKCSKCLNISR